MDWTRQIDIYCERVSDAFWAEPVNALTNIAFILAGVAALSLHARRAGRPMGRVAWLGLLMATGLVALLSNLVGGVWAATASAAPVWLVAATTAASLGILGVALTWAPRAFPDPALSWPALWLSANAIVVGIGSFLFHTVAQPWAGAADSGPILMFILGYFVVAMRCFAELSWGRAALATLGFLLGMVALSAALRPLDGILGGSQSYIPALVALVAVGAWLHRARGHPAGRALMQAGGLFAVSLTFRSLDGPICDLFPLGTHFLWHLFNGWVFWVLLGALVRHGAPTPAPRRARRAAAA